ncbi:hydroxysqualene dehydroxylase HpnE [Ramlibacter tataouinensis]|uniref:hydroxysqualene dehydroxylase HpnE n=1 Tax=Ramlibacter tataouinensis TaxID=94132 RepID=UPI0022F40697|nr:hydroxysqualene dehydroxylase HpnE [Ramlibacter tataouinensis]WBY04062.1 hydroxysqualene dehydroxylase HpnE [Ramlibacter tataouinensis]
MRLAIVGGGWAGLAAAVAATRAGHAVTLLEATRQWGGRARSLPVELPGGGSATLDNGQHILIGAYRDCLALMRQVGVQPAQVLQSLPLTLLRPDGNGLKLPDWPAPFDALWGILRARGWSVADKLSLLAHAARWRLRGFECPDHWTVERLCLGLSPNVLRDLVEPLCVAALNLTAARASAAVFLRVLRDGLFGPRQEGWGASSLLIPRGDLGQVFPDAAARWLAAQGADLRLGARVQSLQPQAGAWQVDGEAFDAVLLACPAWEAARLVAGCGAPADWLTAAGALAHEPIATVYAGGGPRLPLPMLALSDGPAQFVFDRSLLGGPAGVLAFVASASQGDARTVEQAVLKQALALGWRVQPLRTVVEKRATFACVPALRRPPIAIAPGLLACGDYVQGPYPATLEGAVRSALEAVAQLTPEAGR